MDAPHNPHLVSNDNYSSQEIAEPDFQHCLLHCPIPIAKKPNKPVEARFIGFLWVGTPLHRKISGDWANVILNFKGYDQSGSKGVGAYLGGIWFRKKGEPLVSSVSQSDFDSAFGDVDDDFLG